MNSIEHIWDEIGRGFGGIGPSVSEPEATGSCSPTSVATDQGRSQDFDKGEANVTQEGAKGTYS